MDADPTLTPPAPTPTPVHATRVPALDAGLGLPYIVYGTLRPGGSNAHLLARHGATYGEALMLAGYAMYDAGIGYPYVTPTDKGSCVRADLVNPPADARAQRALRRDLDLLEGFIAGGAANNYERVPYECGELGGGIERWGWLYVAGAGAAIDGLLRIDSGDWFAR